MFLTILIFLPFFLGALVLVLPLKRAALVSFIFSVFYFLLSLFTLFYFDKSTNNIQLSENTELFPSLGIHYFVGMDGLSLPLVLLTALLLPLTIGYSGLSVKKHLKGFLSCLFLLTGFVMGSFLALDAVLFYIFFEGSLLPLFFLILIWGGEKRIYAAFKFFIYTALGSLFMLAGILTLMILAKNETGVLTASVLDFYHLQIPFIKGHFLNPQNLLFFCFSFAFAVKSPLFPFHTWLPLAHVEAPTSASVFLAAVILKMGAYGFLRFVLPLFPEAALHFAPGLCFLAAAGILYGAMMALAQSDLKKLIAYSSVSHIGYAILGFFVFNFYALTGGYLQMISHGLSSAGLFFLVGMIYERAHTRQIESFGGLAKSAPRFSCLFFLITLSAIAFPFTAGFISEFLVLFGVFMEDKRWLALAILGVVLGALYMLFLIYRILFGKEKNPSLGDINKKESLVLIPIAAFLFLIGLFPHFILDYSKKSLEHLSKARFHYTLSINGEGKK